MSGDGARIPLQLSRHCVVASIQVDLSEEVLERFRSDLLEFLRTSGATAVILDVSGVEVLDLEEFEALRRTMAMAALMGARTVFSGFRPGVVSSLVELDADTARISAALNLDEAFDMLEQVTSDGPVADDDSEETEEEDPPRNEGDDSGGAS